MDNTAARADHRQPHVLPARVLLGTWLGLVVLTGVTVYVARMDLGDLSVVSALAIASIKASLVALFFMHLKYENRFNLVVLVASVFFALFLVLFVLYDTHSYQPSIERHERATEHATPARTPVQ